MVIGVHSAKFPSEQLTENIRNAVMRHGIEHPVVNDSNMKIWTSYAVRAWPTLIVIDPRGRIAGEISGEILADDLAVTIKEIIDENPAEIDHTPLDLTRETSLVPDFLLRYPAKILVADDGRLFIADTGHHRIIETHLNLEMRQAEVLRVFGSSIAGLRDGKAGGARFNSPHGMALSASGNKLYVADTENHAIRCVDLISGEVTTLAGTGQKAHGRLVLGAPTETPLRSPWALCLIDRYLFIAMAGSHQIWVMIDEKEIGPFAGSGAEALVDGALNECGFNQPSEILEGLGHLWIADPEASAVRAISLVSEPKTITLVGQGLFDYGDQDGPANEALLQHPTGLAFQGETIYIADSYNHKVKTYDLKTGNVASLAGTGKSGNLDGLADEASFYEPEGLAIFGQKLLVADTNNHMIRVIDLDANLVETIELTNVLMLRQEPEEISPANSYGPLVVAPGLVKFICRFQLPFGTKLNIDAPNSLIIKPIGTKLNFKSPEVSWTAEYLENNQITLDYVLYYCDTQDERLCMLKADQFEIPILIDAGANTLAEIKNRDKFPGSMT